MTLAYYYYLLIGLCHKKNRYKYWSNDQRHYSALRAFIQKCYVLTGPHLFFPFLRMRFRVCPVVCCLDMYNRLHFYIIFLHFCTKLLRFIVDNIYVNKKKYITHNEVKSNTYTSKIITKQCIYFYNINTKQCG